MRILVEIELEKIVVVPAAVVRVCFEQMPEIRVNADGVLRMPVAERG